MESYFERGQISEEETSDTKTNSKEKVFILKQFFKDVQ